MSAQLDLIEEHLKQRRARDAALDTLEQTRQSLISIASGVARDICREHGQVTSSDVFRRMKTLGYEPQLRAYDKRWMGAVFRANQGWRKVGQRNDGSHSRPISVWTCERAGA